ncbi:MAG: glycosyltransferase family 9 protein [Candidatus Omnitrophica bacterium]|nr:glycosyltransferase family 9 protein [Candidatus Omnitrophota bacterium]
MNRSIRRVLIAAPYGIGDLLFLTPVFRALRLLPTVEKVDLLLGSRTEVIAESNPHVDEIFSVDKDFYHAQSKRVVLLDLYRLAKRLRRNRYDLLLDYSMRDEYSFFGQFFLGIPIRAGFSYRRRGFFLNRKIFLPQGFYGHHVVNYVCQVAEKAEVPVRDRFMEFYLTDQDRQEAMQYLKDHRVHFKKWITLSPGGGESWGKDAHFKRWPVPLFAALMNGLKRFVDFDGVILLGSSKEKELVRNWQNYTKITSLNAMGEVTLPQAAALIEKSLLFVGNDGGLVHLSHALHVPLIAFYGPVDPEVYGPFPPSSDAIAIYRSDLDCRPCYQKFRYRNDCPGRECLQDLKPEDVLRILEKKNFFKSGIFSWR